MNLIDNKQASTTIVALKNLFHYLDSSLQLARKKSTAECTEILNSASTHVMDYLSSAPDLLPIDEFKTTHLKELERRIKAKCHMDKVPTTTSALAEVENMLEQLMPKSPEISYFTKRLVDSVWTCEYVAISSHQIAVQTWNRNNEIGYENEKELPKGKLIEAEIEGTERTVVGAEIDGKLFEVINPRHVLSYQS